MTRWISATAVAVAFLASGAFAQGATLTIQSSDEHGEYIADADGRALYMFEADTQGSGSTTAVSTCEGDCAAAWPPLAPEGTTEGNEGVSADLIGTIEREDGTTQVTYGGWPLYYFVKDKNPGDTTGHDVEGFGADWYLVAPSGEVVHD